MTFQDYSIVPDEARRPVWVNGALVPWEEATFHVASHVINYGFAVFEGLRFYDTERGPAIFRLDDHIARLNRSAELFQIKPHVSFDQIRDGCIEVVKNSRAKSGVLRPQIQFGLSSRMSFPATDTVDVTIPFWPLGAYREKTGLRVVTSELRKLPIAAVPIEAKVAGYYVNSYLNRRFAESKQVDDAVMLDEHGHVTEASVTHVFAAKDGVLFTPAAGNILLGITRATVMQLAAEVAELQVEERSFGPEALRDADEIFFTGTSAEIEPVTEYDGITIGEGAPGPVTQRISEIYSKAVLGQLPGYESWLTPVNA